MIPFRDLPIRRKVNFLILATSATVLVLTGAAFIGYEALTFRQAALRNIQTIARIIADNSTAALSFRNEKESGELLASVKAESSVTFAGLYDESGRLFASYPDVHNEPDLLGEIPPEDFQFGAAHLRVYQRVAQDEHRLGTLVLRSSLADVYWRLALYGGMVLLILGASCVAAFVLSARLQTGITTPILELARVAETVGTHHDFSVRAQRFGNDELGALTDAFNHMLSEIRGAHEEIHRLNGDLERRVAVRTKELNQTNTELEAFTYSVSHDLRAPLRHLLNYADAIRDDPASTLSPDAVEFLGRIQHASTRLSALVDGLLRLSRVGRQALVCAPADLNHLVNFALRELEAEVRGRDIRWERHPLPVVNCDPTLIVLVFTNLLSNALKYTRPRHPAVVTIGVIHDPREPALFVRDNGVGFDPAYQSRLFGVFERLHSAAEFEGNGVGLATAHRIIRNHGGRMWADGRVNEGATFYFTLPGLNVPAAADSA